MVSSTASLNLRRQALNRDFHEPASLRDATSAQRSSCARASAAAARARYHYLGYKTLVGAQMRYAVHDRNGWPIAMLGFSTAAWKLAPRDNFIGWTPQSREKNLPLVVDNPRFLILGNPSVVG